MTKAWETAVRRGDADGVLAMLTAGADVDAKDQHGQTALMVASRHGYMALVRVLLAHRAMLDHTAKYHLSALMLAVINGHAEIVELLVAAGADRGIRGSGAPGFYQKTAKDLAEDQQRPDLLAALGDP